MCLDHGVDPIEPFTSPPIVRAFVLTSLVWAFPLEFPTPIWKGFVGAVGHGWSPEEDFSGEGGRGQKEKPPEGGSPSGGEVVCRAPN